MNTKSDLNIQIEGVLFYRAEPMKKTELMQFFSINTEELESALEVLENRLASGATRLLKTEKEIQLVTTTELDGLIKGLRKDELKRDIGKAGAETLAIILYRGAVARVEIDTIRGVNSTFILRNLMIRGLISREINQRDSRSFCYYITPELLKHLGITKKEDLQNFSSINDQLDTYTEAQEIQSEKPIQYKSDLQ